MKSALQDYLDQVLLAPPKTPQDLLDAVKSTLKKASYLGTVEEQKLTWEQLLRKAVFDLAVRLSSFLFLFARKF